jgi:hypothetical protein
MKANIKNRMRDFKKCVRPLNYNRNLIVSEVIPTHKVHAYCRLTVRRFKVGFEIFECLLLRTISIGVVELKRLRSIVIFSSSADYICICSCNVSICLTDIPRTLQYTGAGIETDLVDRAYTWQRAKDNCCSASLVNPFSSKLSGISQRRNNASPPTGHYNEQDGWCPISLRDFASKNRIQWDVIYPYRQLFQPDNYRFYRHVEGLRERIARGAFCQQRPQ